MHQKPFEKQKLSCIELMILKKKYHTDHFVTKISKKKNLLNINCYNKLYGG
jgi:hypothetical protein